jgi:hypothetical protein
MAKPVIHEKNMMRISPMTSLSTAHPLDVSATTNGLPDRVHVAAPLRALTHGTFDQQSVAFTCLPHIP